ncbi:hypothetical protein HC723_09105 [Vibrio sp. S11_S32]|uniref:hypothetical protein n=1 Tax=Vibrio sp. S11_S32 TaxID=2720225 RepID=UPI0016803639|nr:hypothetical protein [Vibrio sp. S11_S32]MBD1576594.1 hypothetical protein [Vibrio sp. S11_S32]
MSNWDKWLSNDSRTLGKKLKRDFDDFDGEVVEKSKSRRKAYRDKLFQRFDEFEETRY